MRHKRHREPRDRITSTGLPLDPSHSLALGGEAAECRRRLTTTVELAVLEEPSGPSSHHRTEKRRRRRRRRSRRKRWQRAESCLTIISTSSISRHLFHPFSVKYLRTNWCSRSQRGCSERAVGAAHQKAILKSDYQPVAGQLYGNAGVLFQEGLPEGTFHERWDKTLFVGCI